MIAIDFEKLSKKMARIKFLVAESKKRQLSFEEACEIADTVASSPAGVKLYYKRRLIYKSAVWGR